MSALQGRSGNLANISSTSNNQSAPGQAKNQSFEEIKSPMFSAGQAQAPPTSDADVPESLLSLPAWQRDDAIRKYKQTKATQVGKCFVLFILG